MYMGQEEVEVTTAGVELVVATLDQSAQLEAGSYLELEVLTAGAELLEELCQSAQVWDGS